MQKNICTESWKNSIFGEIKEVTWLSKIPLLRKREQKISACFINEKIDFEYPNTVADFDYLLNFFQRKGTPSNKSYLGKNINFDRLIVMEDFLGLADKSKTFANFLTVSQKFGLTYVYIFHTIYPTRQNF